MKIISNKITSLTNQRIKNVVALRNRRQRIIAGSTIVEGVREVARAMEAGVIINEFYVCRELLKSSAVNDFGIANDRRAPVPVYETTKSVFSKMAYGDRGEGILAVCTPKPLTFKKISTEKQALYVIVESVEKPGNLGAILRTCDGAGIDGVIVCDSKTDIYNPNVIRASLGTVFSVKVVVSSNEEALKFLKLRNIKVCATSPQAKTLYTKIKLTDSLALVVGSEQSGLTEFWSQHADLKVKIPMKGKADSLNVSASTAILLYEVIRQRTR